tara:strand:+ start:4596 stop:4805 length:210 start_codon:yes stop_codon:yes gene_type:complete
MKELMKAREKQHLTVSYTVDTEFYHSEILMQEDIFFTAMAFVCKDFDLTSKEMGMILENEIDIWKDGDN